MSEPDPGPQPIPASGSAGDAAPAPASDHAVGGDRLPRSGFGGDVLAAVMPWRKLLSGFSSMVGAGPGQAAQSGSLPHLELFDRAVPDARWPLVRRWIFEGGLRFFEESRGHRPILVTPQVTLATRYDDCATILRRYDAFTVDLYKPKQGDYWMAQDDTPAHWRQKGIMQAILDREEVPAIRTYVAEKAASILRAAGGRIDAVDQLARAVPIALVQDWFGFADSDPKELSEWSYWNQTDAFWNQPFDAVADPAAIVAKREAANLRMTAYLQQLIGRRIAELKAGQANTDSVSRLLRLAFSNAVQFDVPTVALNVGGLLIGSVETTSHAAINALAGLLGSPELFHHARAAAAPDDPSAFDGYVYEALRFNPAFSYFFRMCRKPTILAGDTEHAVEIQPGTTILAVTHSAMFDPAFFPAPERFDPTRPVDGTFHFGQGLHECLGRAIGQVMIPEIVRQCLRLDGLEAAGPVDYQGGPVPKAYDLRWKV